MLGRFIALLVVALCGACDLGAAWADAPVRELAPAVLFVRQPPTDAAAAGLGPQAILRPPVAPPDGSETRPFPSLREALEAAPAGALLRVEEGIWREKLEITRAVVLMGRGAGRTRIVPPEGTAVAVDVHGADHVQLHGLSIQGASVGLQFRGGVGHRLENVELREQSQSGLAGRGAEIVVAASLLRDIGGVRTGRGIDLDGGILEARHLSLEKAGRRGIFLHGGKARLEDLEVHGSTMGAVHAMDGAEVRVVRGEFEGQGGAALYAGASRLWVEGAHTRHDEYGVMASRHSELSVVDGEITDYGVAGVAFVESHGTVQRTMIARGGTESGIAVMASDGPDPVLLVDNRIHDPGNMGVHVTQSSVTARGNTITGARPDRQKDMGDAFFALESKLVLEDNMLRGNAGSGIATIRCQVRLDRNSFFGNGRAGILLLDRSRGTATGNLFQHNALAAVEVGERARATLIRNRFEGNSLFDIDTGCGKGTAGTAEIGAGNTFAGPRRERACVQ